MASTLYWTKEVGYNAIWKCYSLEFESVNSFVAIINSALSFFRSTYWTKRAIDKSEAVGDRQMPLQEKEALLLQKIMGEKWLIPG